MKILQLGKFYPPDIGGIENAIYNITEELNKREIVCDVLCSNSESKYTEDVFNGYKVYRTKSYGKVASTSITPQIIFKLREIVSRYDIIHMHHPDPMANLALFIVNPKKQKVILHWHSDIIRQKFLLKFYLPLQNWLLNRADAIIGTTIEYIAGSNYLSKYKHKCVSIPCGIRKFDYDINIVNQLRERYRGKKVIFALGRFVYYKGFEYLILSANYMNEDTVLIIGGDGPLKSKYLKMVKKYNLGEKVYLIGNIPQEILGSYYEFCDIFCLSSIDKSEAFGLVQLEAMSFGKPVVATNIPGSGVNWVNQDGITGLNVKPEKPVELANAFKHILKNERLYIFSQNAERRFKEEFTIEKETDRIVELYTRVLTLG